MRNDRIEAKWIDTFEKILKHCQVKPGDEVAILSETQSHQLNVQLCELALQRMGARCFHIVMPTAPIIDRVPLRSTGASESLQRNSAVIKALASTAFVADLTVEGIIHAPELREILAGGTRVYVLSDEHPEILERVAIDPIIEARMAEASDLLRGASLMHVSSDHGTDLSVQLEKAVFGKNWGVVTQPGTLGGWPGGLVGVFPASGTVNGRIVLAPGDFNCTFKRYIETPVTLRIENDFITSIEGDGVDAALFREYYASYGDPEAYGTSHVGWGVNHKAHWESAAMFDKNDSNGAEIRSFAGNFLFSSGANSLAGRFTRCHFDIPMRQCTIRVDNRMVVDKGRLLELT
jgi:2,5-dihydroxypyridine 5,6-dioxygenase